MPCWRVCLAAFVVATVSLAVTVVASQAAPVQVFVAPHGSDGATGTPVDPFLTLAHATAVANSTGGVGSVVIAAAGHYPLPSPLHLHVASLICDADPGACVIDASGATRAIWARDASTVALPADAAPLVSGFTIVTDSTVLGAAVRVDEARVQLIGCTFAGAPRNAVHVAGASAAVTVIGCTFSGNGFSSPGDAAPALHVTGGVVTVTRTSFAGNHVVGSGTTARGGAVRVTGAGTVLQLSHSWLTGNRAHTGGAVWAGAGATLSVNECVFSANHATGVGGGALFTAADAAAVSVNGTVFAANTVDDAATGGAWLLEGGAPMVTWCTFTGAAGPPPQPNDGSHAALAGAGVHVVAGAPVFMDTAFLFLHAMHDGGAVRVSSGTPSFIRVLFQSNVAGTDGGAVSMLGGRPAFTECRAASGVAGGRGGAFYVAGAVPTLVGSLISGNKAGDGGGGIFVTEPTAAVMQVTTIMWSTFMFNSAPDGAAMLVAGHVTLTGCTIMRNFGVNSGGGVRFVNGVLTVSNSTFTGNMAMNGGAMIVTAGTVAVASTVFSGNTAFTAGGAIFEMSTGASTYTDVTLSGNTANMAGAVMLIQAPGSTLWTRCAIYGNRAPTKGGAMLAFGGRHALHKTDVWGNTATEGGGIDMDSGLITITGGTFHHNVAQQGGALFVNDGNLTLSAAFNCSFNRATSGGCLHTVDGSVSLSQGAIVADNVATTGGGARLVAASVHADSTTFLRNRASTGGGVHVDSSADLVVKASRFGSNAASVEGGGLWIGANGLDLEATTFDGNSAGYGGGVHIPVCPRVPMRGATFTGNSAARGGGGLHFASRIVPCASSVCAAAAPCAFSHNVALYGPDMSSQAHHLRVVGVPDSVSGADTFQPTVTALDVFDQPVTALDGVVEAMFIVVTEISGTGASLVGRSGEAVRGGVAHITPLHVLAPADAVVQLEFQSQPATIEVVLPVLVRPCPIGFIALDDGRGCALCRDGTFSWNPANSTCDSCPPNAICRGGSVAFAARSHWQSSPLYPEFHRCLSASACAYTGREFHLMSARNRSSEFYMNAQCAPGYQGVLCAQCSPGYHKSHDVTCAKCGSVAVILIRTVVASGLGVVLLLNTIAVFLRLSRGGKLGHQSMAGQMVKVFVSFLQLSTLIRAVNMDWPDALVQLMGVQGLVVSLLAGDGSLACLAEGGSVSPALVSFYIAVVTPSFACLLLWLGWSGVYWCGRCGKASSGPRPGGNARQGERVSPTEDVDRAEAGAPAHDADASRDSNVAAKAWSSFADFRAATGASPDDAGCIDVHVNSPATPQHLPSDASPAATALHGGKAGDACDAGHSIAAAPNPSDASGAHPAPSPGATTTNGSGDAGPNLDGGGITAAMALAASSPAHASASPHLPRIGTATSAVLAAARDDEDVDEAEGKPVPPASKLAGASYGDGDGALSGRPARSDTENNQELAQARRSYGRYLRGHFVPSALIVFFFMYPQLFHTAVAMLHCVTVDEYSATKPYHAAATAKQHYLARDTGVVCWEGPHVAAAITALVTVAICLVLPALALFQLRANRFNLNDARVVRMYGFLYACYEPEYYWWEFLTLARKVCAVVIVELGTDIGAGTQQQLFIAILVVALAAHFSASPFSDPLCDVLDPILLVVLAFTLYAGHFFQVDVTESWDPAVRDWVQAGLVVMTIIAHVAACVAVVVVILHHIVTLRLWKFAGARASTRFARPDAFPYFRRYFGVRTSRVLATTMVRLDAMFMKRQLHMNVSHYDLTGSGGNSKQAKRRLTITGAATPLDKLRRDVAATSNDS